jgi:hypothetical protein
MNSIRLVLKWRYERLKMSMQSTQLTAEQIKQLQHARLAFSEYRLAMSWLIHLFVVSFCVFMPLFYTDSYWSSGGYGCLVRNADTLQSYGYDVKLDHMVSSVIPPLRRCTFW